ncbi:MAG: hypothetical protein MUO50_06405 [Longimicrobiales bacterium]|nr:hypothetical protein [Longimicrobiales bacterium]
MTFSFQHRAPALRSVIFGLALLVAAGPPTPAAAQDGGLKARFAELFTFGTGCGLDVLFCLRSGSGAPDFAQEAFSTNANATARELTLFLQGAITAGIATVPAPSAGSGETFRLSALGIPVRNEEKSLGPILAERALTLGRGSFLLGANLTVMRLDKLRGTSLEDLHFNVVQRDLPPTGPPLGDPAIERTYLSVKTRMAFEARVANLFMTAGVTDRLDLGILIPVVQATISGFSDAEIMIGEGEDPAAGFSFGGPTEDPKLRERSVVPQERATGLGDISIRGKYRFTEPEKALGLAVLTDIRLPTGRDEDFLGSPGLWVQGLGVMTVDVGSGFTPHANAGLALRSGEGQRNAAILAMGFDHLTSKRLTITGELLAQLPLGPNPLIRKEIVIRNDLGSEISVPTSNLPTLRDNILDGAVGARFRLWEIVAMGNVIVPLNDGGLRSKALWTFGLQASF